MSVTSSSSSVHDEHFRRRPEVSHQSSILSKSAPIRYDPKSCVHCGQIFKYGQSKYEFSGDPILTWNRLCVEINEHYYSCPRTFVNIYPRTSAIRNTLTESTVGKCEGKEGTGSTSLGSAHRDSCREAEGFSRRHNARHTSPESSLFEPRRPKTPDHVGSSHRAAPRSVNYGGTAPTPHSPFQVSENHGRSSLSSSDASRPPLRPLNQRQLSLAFLVSTDPEPVAPSNIDKFPPLYNLKRKLAEFQDGSNAGPRHPTLKSDANSVATNRARTVDAGSPVLRADSPVLPAMSPLVDYDEDGEPPEKRFKKNIMDWRVRKQALEADPLLSIAESKRVFCIPCSKWIKLDARNDYYPGLWKKHRKTMHEKDIESINKLEDSESRGMLGGRTSPSSEQKPRVRRMTTESIQDARIMATDTRVVRSSSPITSSSSYASN